MPTTRVTPKRAPVFPGQDSTFTIRNHPDGTSGWWVHYVPPGQNPIPADDAHPDLVTLVNYLKQTEGNGPGGRFCISEHFQVVARMKPSGGQSNQNAIHVVGLNNGVIATYPIKITFLGGTLDPTAHHTEGDIWSGPLCGISYTFSAPGTRKAPSHNLDEVRIEINGVTTMLSAQAGITPYPPTSGALADFLGALRRQLPSGGRFRVNEHGRAFTAEGHRFIGIIPAPYWFRAILPTD